MLCIGNFEENIDLSHFHIVVISSGFLIRQYKFYEICHLILCCFIKCTNTQIQSIEFQGANECSLRNNAHCEFLADASFGKGCISNCMYPALTILHSVRILLPFPAFFHKKLMTIGTISGWKFSHTFPCLLSHKSLMSCSWEPSSFTRQNIEKNQRKVRKQIIFLNIKKQKHGKKLINFQLPAGQLQESPRLCMVPSFFAIQVCSILRPSKLILGFRGHSLHACSSCTS